MPNQARTESPGRFFRCDADSSDGILGHHGLWRVLEFSGAKGFSRRERTFGRRGISQGAKGFSGAMNVAPTTGSFNTFCRWAGAFSIPAPFHCHSHPLHRLSRESGNPVAAGIDPRFREDDSLWIGIFGRHECRPYIRFFQPVPVAGQGIASSPYLPSPPQVLLSVILAKAGIHGSRHTDSCLPEMALR